MNEYPSPDELDSLGYAFMEIQTEIRLRKYFKIFSSNRLKKYSKNW